MGRLCGVGVGVGVGKGTSGRGNSRCMWNETRGPSWSVKKISRVWAREMSVKKGKEVGEPGATLCKEPLDSLEGNGAPGTT